MSKKNDNSLDKCTVILGEKKVRVTMNSSHNDFNSKTIDDLIKEVLKSIGPKPQEKESNSYQLICSCGRPYESKKKLCEAKCQHYLDKSYDPEKDKNPAFVLEEKQPFMDFSYDKYLSIDLIEQLVMKATGAKEPPSLKGLIPEKKVKFNISENLKKKMKELIKKKDNGEKIEHRGFTVKYDQNKLTKLTNEIGIEAKKARAALRMTENNENEAISMATDPERDEVFEHKEYLFVDNNEVMTKREFDSATKDLIKKEYPDLKEQDIKKRVEAVIKKIGKKNGAPEESIEDSAVQVDEDEDDEGLDYNSDFDESSEYI